MDFESRDYYRHEVEKLARIFGITETLVTEKAVECAGESGESPKDHVGYYLVGSGRKILLDRIGKTARRRRRFLFSPLSEPKRLYIGLTVSLAVFMVTYFMYYAWTNTPSPWAAALAGILVLLPCTELALRFSNTIISHIYSPTILPKLELRNGIPEDHAAFVITPALLTSQEQAKELVRQMEVNYLANREANPYFALVGDFRDASSETLDADGAITGAALRAVEQLNGNTPAKARRSSITCIAAGSSTTHRAGGWAGKGREGDNRIQQVLRGAQDTSFSIVSGDVSASASGM